MKVVFQMEDRFGSFLENGDLANAFRFTQIEPALSRGDTVVFNFAGVTNMTSSFCNALFATLMAHHEPEFNNQVSFLNCTPIVKDFIIAAMALGRREAHELA